MIVARGGKGEFQKVYAFNTFFYPKLTDTGYDSVKRWTKQVDIFAHDLVIVPVSYQGDYLITFVLNNFYTFLFMYCICKNLFLQNFDVNLSWPVE